jgi:hypothetical protein
MLDAGDDEELAIDSDTLTGTEIGGLHRNFLGG